MTLTEEYTLLQQLGTGGFATVYKARHNQLGYIRAIRMLNAFVPDEQSEIYQKFLRECKVLLRLGNGNHPNIVHVYQPRLVDGHALVEMDYVEGMDLTHYIKEHHGFVPIEDVLAMAREISSALAFCHHDIYRYCMDRKEDNLQTDPNDGSKVIIDADTEHRLVEKYKIIHNDIHSGNIMRRIDGHYTLLDFGLAIEGGDVIHSSRHENGAPEYKAPEKWDSDTLLNEQTDIYSFGIVLYEYLSGRVPFPFDKSLSDTKANYIISEAHKNVVPESIRPLREKTFKENNPGCSYTENYPQWLEDIIMRCIEKDPMRRFHSGLELYQAISNGLNEHSESHQAHASNQQPWNLNDSQYSTSSQDPISSLRYSNTTNVNQEDNTQRYRPYQDDIYTEAKARSNQQSHQKYHPYQDDIYADAQVHKVHAYKQQRAEHESNNTGSYSNNDVASKNSNKSFSKKTKYILLILIAAVIIGFLFFKNHNKNVFKVGDVEFKMVHVAECPSGDFYIGETEVTQALWIAVMGEELDQKWTYDKGLGNDCPVYYVSYSDVMDFITALNHTTKRKFRLPTEDEWEYAARGGNKSHGYQYSGGDDIEDVAWYEGNSQNKVHPVKLKKPNELGIYDMSGNVYEWCSSMYDYSNDVYIYRGGSLFSRDCYCRVSFRNQANQFYAIRGLGFRLAMEP